MAVTASESNWLEKLADVLPGIAGYRGKEARRETDKRLREFMAHRVEECAHHVEDARQTHFQSKGLAGLDAYGRLINQLRGAVDSLRFASYGYSGFFDQIKVREEELDNLYNFDLSLLSDVRTLESTSRKGGEDLERLSERVDAIRRKVEERKHLFEKIPRTGE